MRHVRKFIKIALTAARSDMAYLSEVLGRTLFLGVVLFIFLRLWQVTFSESGADRLGGLSLSDMLWYLTLSEAIVLSDTRLTRKVDDDVRSGTLAVNLIRPVSYPMYTMSVFLGERMLRFATNLTIGGLVALVLVGPPPVEAITPLLVLPAVLLAFILDGSMQLVLGLFAFWMEDTSGLFLIYSRLRMILGGMLIPIQLMPDWIRPFLNALPFPSTIYAPAHLFVTGDAGAFGALVFNQTCWILVALSASALVYKKALTRVAVNGG